jgi:hypothetical protein
VCGIIPLWYAFSFFLFFFPQEVSEPITMVSLKDNDHHLLKKKSYQKVRVVTEKSVFPPLKA